MKFACLSCGAKYSVPDGRLSDAGAEGLRVRCSRCRAIMVVADSQAALQGASLQALTDDISVDGAAPLSTYERIPTRSMRITRAMEAQPGLTASMQDAAIPATLSASGLFRPLPGVHREVTGMYFPNLEEITRDGTVVTGRVWYAAVDHRPRGPFSASEMIGLAEKGKIRDGTLVWRPGFGTWKRVKHGEVGTREDLSWLRKVVLARKLRELETLAGPSSAPPLRTLDLRRTALDTSHDVVEEPAPAHRRAVWSSALVAALAGFVVTWVLAFDSAAVDRVAALLGT